jgi:hypothetical protein
MQGEDGIDLVSPDEVNAFKLGEATIFYRRLPGAEISRLNAKYRIRGGADVNTAGLNTEMLRKGICGWSKIRSKPAHDGQPAEYFPDWLPEKGEPDARLLDDLLRRLPHQVIHDIPGRDGLLSHMTKGVTEGEDQLLGN